MLFKEDKNGITQFCPHKNSNTSGICDACIGKEFISPHQEPVATQHDVECKGCGGVSCKNKVLKGGTVCPSCFEKMTTQEPMEWQKQWEKECGFLFQKNLPELPKNQIRVDTQGIIKNFIQSQIKQAEERHNQDCTREEWVRADEREKITFERLSELKQCPQCHTMKAFSTNICFRCLDINEAERIVKVGYDSMLDQKIMEAVAEERQFVLNILDGIDVADKETGNKGGGTLAIRHALNSRIITNQ